MKRVFVAGVFDFFHEGHRFFLEEAKRQGDLLIVVIARDISVQRQKGFFPFFSEEVRLRDVLKSRLADEVFLGDAVDFRKSLEKAAPHLLAFGYDQKIPEFILRDFPHLPWVRLASKNPDTWKSSVFRKQLISHFPDSEK